MKKLFNKITCLVLVIGLICPFIKSLKVAAVSVSNILKPLTIRIATDGFEYPNFNSIIPEFDEALLKEASSDFIYYNQYNKWDMLVNYDKLSYGEIHRRVQDDIYKRNKTNIELPFYRMYPIFQLFRDSSILLLEAVLRVAVCPLFCLLLFFLFLLFQSHFLR